MAKLRPPIEWEPYHPKRMRQYGMQERHDDKWEVVHRVKWWSDAECEVLVVVDSRDAAIGFIKLLKEE